MVIRRQVLELPTNFYHATKQKIKLSLLLKLSSNLKLLTSSQLPIRLKTNFSPFECQNSNWESRLNSRQPYLLLVLSDSKVLSNQNKSTSFRIQLIGYWSKWFATESVTLGQKLTSKIKKYKKKVELFLILHFTHKGLKHFLQSMPKIWNTSI